MDVSEMTSYFVLGGK